MCVNKRWQPGGCLDPPAVPLLGTVMGRMIPGSWAAAGAGTVPLSFPPPPPPPPPPGLNQGYSRHHHPTRESCNVQSLQSSFPNPWYTSTIQPIKYTLLDSIKAVSNPPAQ